MSELKGFLRRRRLWIAFAAVFLPLSVLLGLQYTWLVRLERTSALAHEASLTRFLDAVSAEVHEAYTTAPRRALELPASLFTEARCGLAASWFAQRRFEGARRVFAVDLSGEHAGELFVWDPAAGAPVEPTDEEWRTIALAVAPWKVMALKDLPMAAAPLRVSDEDPARRMLLLPALDARSRIVGAVGMVVDPVHLTEVVLPAAMARVLPRATGGSEARDNLVVTVRDARGRPLYRSAAVPDGADEVVRTLPPVFSDWRLGLRSRYVTPRQWARANFGMNLTLALLIAAVLVAGMILALRMASREMALSRMKSDFVSNVSHELRTPLSSIRVFAELLRRGHVEDAARVRTYGAYIEGESRRLGLLIDNILDLSKIESDRKTYRFAVEDLRSVACEVVETFQVREAPQGFDIAFRAPECALPVRMDASAVAQAVHNLLDNAVKYSGHSRRVEVGAAREGEEVVLEVRDWGIGIPPAEWSKVFERFHRVGTGLLHDVKGSGLGLAIVAHVAHAHGGRVVLDSEPGRGSTFTLRLPAAPAGGG